MNRGMYWAYREFLYENIELIIHKQIKKIKYSNGCIVKVNLSGAWPENEIYLRYGIFKEVE